MALDQLNVEITAAETLSDALDNVSQSATKANKSLESVEDTLDSLSASAAPSSQTVEKLQNDLRDTITSAEGAGSAIDSASRDMAELGVSAKFAEENTKDMGSGFWKGFAAALSLSGALKELTATTQVTQSTIDEAEDETDEYRNALFEASGAAQALNLSSSALSINVGAFTIALRNATTQVPSLVAVLGNLATAFIGVGGAAVLAAGGIAGVVAGGVLTKIEDMTGDFEDMEDVMNAVRAIGQEIASMFLEAAEPLMEMEGAAARFESIIETLATTANAFAEGIRRSFEAGQELFGIADFMDIIGKAWMDNLDDIIAGFQTLFHNLGPPLANMIAFAIENFDEFAQFVSQVTLEVIEIVSAVRGSFGDFVRDIMELGIAVGSGLVPVMDIFFTVMSEIATIINETDMEAVALAVKLTGLVLILNKISGVMAVVIGLFGALPVAMADSIREADSFAASFGNMSKRIGGFLSSYSGGFGKLVSAIGEGIPKTLKFGGAIDSLGSSIVKSGGFMAFARMQHSRFKDEVSDFGWVDAMLLGLTRINTKLGIFSTQTLLSAKKLKSGLGDALSTISRGPLLKMGSGIRGLSDRMFESSYVSDAVANKFWKLGASMGTNISTTKALSSLYSLLTSRLYTLLPAQIASATSMVTSATSMVTSAIASKTLGAALSALKVQFIVTKLAALGLTAALSPLGVAAGAIVAVLGAVVLIGGAVTLALAKLGQSGQSASDMMGTLRDVALEIAQAVAPLFIDSANMLMDILNSIMAPVNALVGGFEDIAVALGFAGDGAGEGMSKMDMLMAVINGTVAAIQPFIDVISYVARLIGGMLAQEIEKTMDGLQNFLVAAGAGEKLRKIFDQLKNAIGPVKKLVKTMFSMMVSEIKIVIGIIRTLFDIFIGIYNTILGLFGLDLASVFGGMLDGIAWLIGGLTGIVETINSVIGAITGLWNNKIAGELFSIEVPGWVPKYAGKEWTMDIPKIGGSGGGSSGSGGGGGDGTGIEESSLTMDDAISGAKTAKGVKDKAAEKISPGGSAANIEYNEGDQMNNYRQNIQADPEDKDSLKRVVKDAMEEANSFRRQQEGHTG